MGQELDEKASQLNERNSAGRDANSSTRSANLRLRDAGGMQDKIGTQVESTEIPSFGLSSMLITIIATRLNLETGRSPS